MPLAYSAQTKGGRQESFSTDMQKHLRDTLFSSYDGTLESVLTFGSINNSVTSDAKRGVDGGDDGSK